MLSGIVSASRPDGLTRPNRTSAIALPPAWPSSQPSMTAGTALSHGLVASTAPLDRITTVRGLTLATSSISRRWSAGRSMPSRSAPSVSRALPTKTSATSLACATATASASRSCSSASWSRSGAVVDGVAGREEHRRLGRGGDLGEGVVEPGRGDLGAAAALVARGAGELAEHRDGLGRRRRPQRQQAPFVSGEGVVLEQHDGPAGDLAGELVVLRLVVAAWRPGGRPARRARAPGPRRGRAVPGRGGRPRRPRPVPRRPRRPALAWSGQGRRRRRRPGRRPRPSRRRRRRRSPTRPAAPG